MKENVIVHNNPSELNSNFRSLKATKTMTTMQHSVSDRDSMDSLSTDVSAVNLLHVRLKSCIIVMCNGKGDSIGHQSNFLSLFLL
jgi:hypothetical protein